MKRYEIVSEPGAAIEVTQMNLTPEEEAGLTINVRLSDIGNATRIEEPYKDLIDHLALALTDHHHQWSPELRAEYETLMGELP